MHRLRLYFSITLLTLAALASDTAFAQEPMADVSSGKALYDTFQCWQCHGYEGQGGRSGPRLVPSSYPYVVFNQVVRYTNLMPAYSPNELSDAQLKKIYEFVQSLPKPSALEDVSKLKFD